MRFRTAVLLSLSLGALACGRIREVKSCRALAQLVNPALDDVAQHLAKDKGSAPYRFAATRYTKLAADLQHFEVRVPRIQKSVEELAAAMNDAAGASARLADALEQREAVPAASARRDLAHTARLQKTIVARIDSDCGG